MAITLQLTEFRAASTADKKTATDSYARCLSGFQATAPASVRRVLDDITAALVTSSSNTVAIDVTTGVTTRDLMMVTALLWSFAEITVQAATQGWVFQFIRDAEAADATFRQARRMAGYPAV